MTFTVACYFWTDPHPSRFNAKYRYTADDVRLLQAQVAYHLTLPHEFVVLTDNPAAFENDAAIRAVPLDLTTHIPGTEFIKLMTFHPEASRLIGERILQIDLDTLIVGNMDHIGGRTEDLVVWRNPSRVPWNNPSHSGRPYYNGSLILYRPGTWDTLWTQFSPEVHKKGCRDTQVWMSYKTGPDMPYFDGTRDGVYRLAREDTPGSGVWRDLPENACIVTFPGSEGKACDLRIRADNPWISEALALFETGNTWAAA